MEYTTYTTVLLQDTDCLSRYGDLHHKDKIVTKLFYSYNGNSYTDNMTPDGKVHGANMEPTWVLLAPDGPHAGPMNLAIRDILISSEPLGSHYQYKYHFKSIQQEL